jgi:lipopolysaccharide export system protein LptA
VEGRAKEMVYDESKRTGRLQGDVVIRQGDIQTKSPEATLHLTADGTGIETLRRAARGRAAGDAHGGGAAGTYTPKDETMILRGTGLCCTTAPATWRAVR